MRVLNSSAGETHSHSHSHSHSHAPSSGKSTAVRTSGELRSRKSPSDVTTITPEEPKEVNPSLRLSAYLNLFGDFTHNITDGLAMAASFYSSPALGAVTTIATFCHEIPHEVGSMWYTSNDRSPIIQSSSSLVLQSTKLSDRNSSLL